MRLVILIIAALLLGTITCAATCAAATTGSSCHHDQKSPTACAHELVMENTHTAAILPTTFALGVEPTFAISLDSPFCMSCSREAARISLHLRI